MSLAFDGESAVDMATFAEQIKERVPGPLPLRDSRKVFAFPIMITASRALDIRTLSRSGAAIDPISPF